MKSKRTNSRIQTLKRYYDLLWEFTFYVRCEVRNPAIYFTSLVTGLLIIWIMNAPSIVPFLIPFIVQAFILALLRFRNKDIDSLLLLPSQRQDPAFITDLSGNIQLSTGKTAQLFEKKRIFNIIDLIGADGFERLINKLDQNCIDPKTRSIDLYSNRLQNWYKVKFKPIISHCGKLPGRLLVWFSEITTQREAELRQRDLLHYTDSLISNIKTLAKEMSTYDHLAAFILNNYKGVLIARIDSEGNLNGYVFKRIGEQLHSEAIVIESNSYAPVFLSRREMTVISDDTGYRENKFCVQHVRSA